MSKTLLDSIRAVTGELGFIQPSVVTSSQELTTIQLKYLCIAAGDELLDAHDWQALCKVHTITTDGNTSYPLPSDYHRMVNMTAWNSTSQSTIDGSSNNAMWNEYTKNNVGTRFRIVGNRFTIPVATTGEVISFLYISKNYIIDGTNGLPKAEFSLDSDSTIYHARLLINFLKLKFLQSKNLDTRGAVEDFNAALQAAIGTDTPSPVLTTQAPVGEIPYDTEY